MDETKVLDKIKTLLNITKEELIKYSDFVKKKIRLYEIRREYNMSVFELGHQFYATTKTGTTDIKVFSDTIERLKELENKLSILHKELHTVQSYNQGKQSVKDIPSKN